MHNGPVEGCEIDEGRARERERNLKTKGGRGRGEKSPYQE